MVETFSKIKQLGSIEEYQEKFEEPKSQVMFSLPHVPESYYITVFTSGLKGEIRSMAKMMKLCILAKTFEIASLQESTIQAIHKFQKPSSFSPKKWNPYPPNPSEETKNKEPWYITVGHLTTTKPSPLLSNQKELGTLVTNAMRSTP